MIEIAKIKAILFFIAIAFSNPFVPDFGTQFILAFAIGMVLPCRIVRPLHEFILKIPQIRKFEKHVKKHKRVREILKSRNQRVKTVVSRVLAGYIVTYIIALLAGLAYIYLEFLY